VMLVGEREETNAEPVFAEIEPIEEDSSSFDPLMSGDLHTIPESALPAAHGNEFRLASPGPRTPVPTDFNQFLKRGPDSGATLSRHPAPRPADSSDTLPNMKTDKTETPPAPGPAVKVPPPAPAAETVAAASSPAPPSKPLPSIPPESIPVLGKPMEELMDFPFTPPEAFVVSRINGTWDVRSIARISPFPEPEVTRIFQKLHKSGVITFK
jgi:hypothetical protein